MNYTTIVDYHKTFTKGTLEGITVKQSVRFPTEGCAESWLKSMQECKNQSFYITNAATRAIN